VTCGKADMGQYIYSTMAQIVCEELGANWKDMRVQLASNDPTTRCSGRRSPVAAGRR
jgi:isoquinoline 1-oxidoreductase beta subunit